MRPRGVTLIQMLVVLSIIGILLAISAPSLGGFINNSRANETAATLAAGLRVAGGQSLSRSEGITVSVTDGGNSITWKNTAATFTEKRVLPYNATITGVTPAGDIVFTGRGLPLQQYTLALKQGNLNRTVVLLVTGKVVVP